MRYRKKRMPTYVIAPLKGFEWKRACLELGGTFIELSETSSSHINIMDVRVRDTSADAMIDSVTENKSANVSKDFCIKKHSFPCLQAIYLQQNRMILRGN